MKSLISFKVFVFYLFVDSCLAILYYIDGLVIPKSVLVISPIFMACLLVYHIVKKIMGNKEKEVLASVKIDILMLSSMLIMAIARSLQFYGHAA